MTKVDFEAARQARRERIATRPPGPEPPAPIASAFQEGAEMACPIDGATMVFTRALTHLARVQAGLLGVANLSAFVCKRCGERSYDPPSLSAIQEALAREFIGMGVRAKLSKLARNNIGVYLPQDLQRHLGVQAGDVFVLQPVGRDFLVVQIERASDRPPVANKRRRFIVATEMFTRQADDVIVGGFEVVEGEALDQAAPDGVPKVSGLKTKDVRRPLGDIRTDESVPADSPTAGMKIVYGGKQ